MKYEMSKSGAAERKDPVWSFIVTCVFSLGLVAAGFPEEADAGRFGIKLPKSKVVKQKRVTTGTSNKATPVRSMSPARLKALKKQQLRIQRQNGVTNNASRKVSREFSSAAAGRQDLRMQAEKIGSRLRNTQGIRVKNTKNLPRVKHNSLEKKRTPRPAYEPKGGPSKRGPLVDDKSTRKAATKSQRRSFEEAETRLKGRLKGAFGRVD